MPPGPNTVDLSNTEVQDGLDLVIQRWLNHFKPACSICGNERDWNGVAPEGARAMGVAGDVSIGFAGQPREAHFHPRISIVCCVCGAVVSLSLQHLQGWVESGFSPSYRSIVPRKSN